MAESGTENLVVDPYRYLKQEPPVFAIRLVCGSNDFSIAKVVTKPSIARFALARGKFFEEAASAANEGDQGHSACMSLRQD